MQNKNEKGDKEKKIAKINTKKITHDDALDI